MTIKNYENLLEKISKSDELILKDGYFGIERETLRISNNYISKLDHHLCFGSPLCNEYITTDFSESLLELITPPATSKNKGFKFLDNIHHFVARNIGKEVLWPFSMPPYVRSDDDIKIAFYGNSNPALFKVLYRKGLSNRYGRLMQSVAGLHFNYSFPEQFWTLPIFDQYETSRAKLKEHIYMRAVRNINRNNWIIFYFFGASPVVSKNFSTNKIEGLKDKDDFYYLDYATSFRNSKLGYQPVNQQKLKISLESIKKYAEDLIEATNTTSKEFEKISIKGEEKNQQINASVLQIEDEYYSVARPKSSSKENKRMATKLMDNGVDYIELRSLDLDPFSRSGIKRETIDFLEIFIIYCSLTPSNNISDKEMEEIKHNEELVSLEGRRPGIKLKNNDIDISLTDWANEILDGMGLVASLMKKNPSILNKYRNMAIDPSKTLSGQLLKIMDKKNLGFHEVGNIFANKYKKEYLSVSQSKNNHWKRLESHCIESVKIQENIEKTESKSFEKYMSDYFKE